MLEVIIIVMLQNLLTQKLTLVILKLISSQEMLVNSFWQIAILSMILNLVTIKLQHFNFTWTRDHLIIRTVLVK
jgi:hypothetical protein